MQGAGPSLCDRLADKPLIIAHRGYRACYPENTCCAFAASIGRCGMIELDVQLTADNMVVVLHDRDLTRTTNARKLAAPLGQTSFNMENWPLAHLRRLDAGSWFLSADPFGTIRQGRASATELSACMPQRIPSLRRVLRWAASCRMPLNIELKDLGAARRNEELVIRVVREVVRADLTDMILLSSFNHGMLRLCRQSAPNIATAALQTGSHPFELIPCLRSLGVVAYHPANGLVDQPLVSALRSAGLHVNVFTVNDPERQRQLFRFGVTGIFTDYLNCQL